MYLNICFYLFGQINDFISLIRIFMNDEENANKTL